MSGRMRELEEMVWVFAVTAVYRAGVRGHDYAIHRSNRLERAIRT